MTNLEENVARLEAQYHAQLLDAVRQGLEQSRQQLLDSKHLDLLRRAAEIRQALHEFKRLKQPRSGMLKELIEQVGTKLHEQYSDTITAQQETGDSIVLEVIRTTHYGFQDFIFPIKQTAPKGSLEAELYKSLKRSRGRARHFAGFLVVGNKQKAPVSPYEFIMYRIIDLDVPYQSKTRTDVGEPAQREEAALPTAARAQSEKQTLRQELYEILQSSEEPMENAQIARALARRRSTSPKKLTAVVSVYLNKYPEFTRVSRGVYTVERKAQSGKSTGKARAEGLVAPKDGEPRPFPYNRWVSFTDLRLSGNTYDQQTILRHAEEHPDLIKLRTEGNRREILPTPDNAHLLYRDAENHPMHALTVQEIAEQSKIPREFITAHVEALGKPVHGRDGLLGYHPARVEALKVLYENLLKK